MHKVKIAIFLFALYFQLNYFTYSLVVNYKNKGNEVIREIIESQPEDQIIFVKFQLFDGTLVTQLIDFKNVS